MRLFPLVLKIVYILQDNNGYIVYIIMKPVDIPTDSIYLN